jgi:transcriptional regulator with XRE-family HTH domain
MFIRSVETENTARKPSSPGAVLRRWRHERRLTLAEVSALGGVSTATLSRIERGTVAVNWAKLDQICRNLGVDITLLFTGDEPAGGARPPASRRSITRAGQGARTSSVGACEFHAAVDLLSKRCEPLVAEVHGRSLEACGGLARQSGETYAYVLEGEVDLHSDVYAPARLAAGDSVYFDATMGHAYVKAADGPCRVLIVTVSAPDQVEARLASTGARASCAG